MDIREILRRVSLGFPEVATMVEVAVEKGLIDDDDFANRCVDALILVEVHKWLTDDLREADGDEIKTLAAVQRFMTLTSIPIEAVAALSRVSDRLVDDRLKVYREKEGKTGRPPMPMQDAKLLAWCAAAVTVLNERCGGLVDAAAQQVAIWAGVDKKKLVRFRDHINRGQQSAFTIKMYNQSRAYLTGLPDDAFKVKLEAMCRRSRAFVRNP